MYLKQLLCGPAYLEVLCVTFKLCYRTLLPTCAAAKNPRCSWVVVSEYKSARAGLCSTLLTTAVVFAGYLCAGIPQTSARCPQAAQYVEHGTCSCSGPSVTRQARLGQYGSELWTYRVSDEALNPVVGFLDGFAWPRSNTQTMHFLPYLSPCYTTESVKVPSKLEVQQTWEMTRAGCSGSRVCSRSRMNQATCLQVSCSTTQLK